MIWRRVWRHRQIAGGRRHHAAGIGLLIGNVDFSQLFIVLKEGAAVHGPYLTVEAAKKAGAVTLNIGLFINAVISFLIVAFAVFMLVKT